VTKNLEQILISYDQADFKESIRNLFSSNLGLAYFGPADISGNRKSVTKVMDKIVENGDAAIVKYTEKFDSVKLTPDQFRISQEDLKQAHENIDAQLLDSIRKSIENVRKYQTEVFIGNNKSCSNNTGIKYTPIDRVGICVPGASAPLPSTVIMTAVPAQVAGVEEIVVISPPRYNGTIHPVILATCYELGITEVYRIGGSQAVAALAIGTETILCVDKIVGPGNQWVQTAKQIAFGLVDIDSIAGPSEVLIIADDSANPVWIAADMLSQAEHAPGCALLFTTSHKLADSVLAELKTQVQKLDRAEQTIQCLIDFSGIVVFENNNGVINYANEFAAEHLQIQCNNNKEILNKIKNAGAIFIGPHSPVAVGDYFAGPSHTLPSGRSARFFSALSSNDFVKSTSIIEYDKDMLAASAKDIIRLAKAEGLDAHAKSVEIRLKD